MGKKSTTTKAVNEPWVTSAVQGLTSDIGNIDLSSAASRVAGTNPLLEAAQKSLLGGPSQQITDLISRGTGGGGGVGYHSASQYMDQYKNPYLKDVLDTSLADFDVGAGRTRAAEDWSLGKEGGFQSSNSAIRQALTDEGLARGRGSLSAGIRSDAFNTAANLGGADAARFTQADSTNAQLAESAAGRALQAAGLLGNMENQRLGQQLSLGEYLRGIEDERLNADINLLGKKASLTGSLPLNLFSGSKTTQSGGTLGAIGSGLLGAASLFAAPMTGGLSLGALGGLGSIGGAAAGAGGLMKAFGR